MQDPGAVVFQEPVLEEEAIKHDRVTGHVPMTQLATDCFQFLFLSDIFCVPVNVFWNMFWCTSRSFPIDSHVSFPPVVPGKGHHYLP